MLWFRNPLRIFLVVVTRLRAVNVLMLMAHKKKLKRDREEEQHDAQNDDHITFAIK